jgi:hypothetical protein
MSLRSRILFVLLGCFACSAQAYIDPGSSLLALQGLLAVLGALMAWVLRPLRWLKRLWHTFRKKDPPDA